MAKAAGWGVLTSHRLGWVAISGAAALHVETCAGVQVPAAAVQGRVCSLTAVTCGHRRRLCVGPLWQCLNVTNSRSLICTSALLPRSGETEDTFIADISVGLSTGHIKSGAPCRCGRPEAHRYSDFLLIPARHRTPACAEV
jgi:hypothetical protein